MTQEKETPPRGDARDGAKNVSGIDKSPSTRNGRTVQLVAEAARTMLTRVPR